MQRATRTWRMVARLGGRRRARLAGAGMGLALAVAAVVVPVTLAAADVQSNAGFEFGDGNLSPSTGLCTTSFDWNCFTSAVSGNWTTGTAPTRDTAPATGITVTAPNGNVWSLVGFEDAWNKSTDTSFKGGTKQDTRCPSVVSSSVPNKDDDARMYLAATTDQSNGHTYLAMAWVRGLLNTTQSSAFVGFEFNQGTLGSCSGSTLSQRTGGDMLVVYNFTGGTATPTILLYRWLDTYSPPVNSVSTQFDPAGYACIVNSSSAATGCWGAVGTGVLSAAQEAAHVNTATATDGICPPSIAGGYQTPGYSNGTCSLGTYSFGEAGIDLTAATVFTPGQCSTFGTAEAESRSSGDSGSAAQEDLVGPGAFNLTNCGSINVTKTGSDGDTAAQQGAQFELFSDGNGTTAGTEVDTNLSCTIAGADGQCGTAPTFDSLAPGWYTVKETTTPAGYTTASDITHHVGTSTTSVSFAFTDVAEPASIAISKTDDSGAPLDGVVFTAYDTATKSNSEGTCTTADNTATGGGDGTCTISDLTPGTYFVDEVAPSGYGKGSASVNGGTATSTWPVSVTVDRGGSATVAAQNPRLFKAIVIVCKQGDNSLYPSAISINGIAKGNSLSAADLPANVSAAQICGISDGSASGLTVAGDNHSATIDIPSSQ